MNAGAMGQVEKFSGNQKWKMYCLERLLDMHEKMG